MNNLTGCSTVASVIQLFLRDVSRSYQATILDLSQENCAILLNSGELSGEFVLG